MLFISCSAERQFKHLKHLKYLNFLLQNTDYIYYFQEYTFREQKTTELKLWSIDNSLVATIRSTFHLKPLFCSLELCFWKFRGFNSSSLCVVVGVVVDDIKQFLHYWAFMYLGYFFRTRSTFGLRFCNWMVKNII